jgi:hypothetical protein
LAPAHETADVGLQEIRVMAIESAGRILVREIRQAAEALYNRVMPVYHINDKDEAALYGSAVLLRIGAHSFLATAKHVIDESTRSSLYVDGPSKLEPFEGDFFASPDHDVAVLKLDPAQLDLLRKYQFLAQSDLVENAFISRCKYATSVGYPASKNKRFHDRPALRREIFSYSDANLTIAQNQLHVRFRKCKNVDALTGGIVSAPDPYGMSGGAMFGTEINDDAIRGHPHPHLIGILIEWHELHEKMVATPLWIVLAVIRDAYGITLPDRLAQPLIRTRSAAYARKS